jgi:hypothetical protein
MSRARVALVAGLTSIASGLASGQSAEVPTALSDALRTHLRADRLVPVTVVAGLPGAVRDGLKTLFDQPTLELAEPGAEFQSTDVIMKPDLPGRRLIAAGCSADHCLVYYERGGIAHSFHVVLFAVAKSGARFEWGGSAPSALASASLEEIKRAVLSGQVKGQPRYW